MQGSSVQRAADFAMGFTIPVHALIGMQGVVSDYVPPSKQGPVRMGTLALAGVMGLGMLKVNMLGTGVTRSVKHFWATTPSKQQQSKH